MLVTSRETLRLERRRSVPGASLTRATAHPQDSAVGHRRSEAVTLFTDRARAVRHDFAVTGGERRHRRRDLSPVGRAAPRHRARQRSAQRLHAIGPLRDRLDERLDVLGAGGRDLPDRQRTLRGAIGWSYELLDETERDVFELLSVFSSTGLGGARVGGERSAGPDQRPRLPRLAGRQEPDALRGYRGHTALLDAPHDQGVRRVETGRVTGPEEAVRRAHANHFCGLVAGTSGRLHSSERQTALADLEPELGNLRVAWDYWVDRDGVEQCSR